VSACGSRYLFKGTGIYKNVDKEEITDMGVLPQGE
jgi:hypothetical protein